MAWSKAGTVADYLAELPPERRDVMSRVRDAVRKGVPGGYEEHMGWGMITWSIPLSTFPDTYNGQPLCIAALGSQKNHCSLYLMGPYGNPVQLKKLQEGFREAGKKLDMGKSCVRFKSADDLPLDVIAEVLASTPPAKLIEWHEMAHGQKKKVGKKKATARKSRRS